MTELENFAHKIKEFVEEIMGSEVYSSKIKFSGIEYSKSSDSYSVKFTTVTHLNPSEYVKLYAKLRRECESRLPKVRAYLNQNNFTDEFFSDSKKAEVYIKDFVVYIKQAMLPFCEYIFVSCTPKEAGITITDKFAYDIFKRLGIREKIRSFLGGAYDFTGNVKVSLNEDYSAEGEQYVPSFDLDKEIAKKNISKMPARQAARSTPKTAQPVKEISKEKNFSRSRTKSVVSIDSAPMAINTLVPNEEAVIEGKIISTEAVAFREGASFKHKFDVYDKTNTVTCCFFESATEENKASSLLKAGKYVKVKGSYYYDKYEREHVINVKEMCGIEVEGKKDLMEQKRVELHMHTNMSAQDALASASDIIARAASYGHKAIAITDHGVVQSFPEAAGAAKKHGIKLIYGVEGYLADDNPVIFKGDMSYPLLGEYVVFDIETTGLDVKTCEITEIGAVRVVNGVLKDEFKSFVSVSKPLSANIVSLTGITDDMLKGAPDVKTVLADFKKFCGNAVMVAHNAKFDTKFIWSYGEKNGIIFENDILDSIDMAKLAFPELSRYKLNIIAKHLKIPLVHHRAVNDAICTAKILVECFNKFAKEKQCETLGDVVLLAKNELTVKNMNTYHIILLCKNKTGLKNMYRLISDAHLNHFYKKPKMLKSLIAKYREGLIIGSACEQGELFRAMLAGKSDTELRKIAEFYDYLEIQPLCNNAFMIKKGEAADMEELKNYNRRIYNLGISMGKPVVATCDAHFLDKEDKVFREIIFTVNGYSDTEQSDLYFRTTDEMMAEFEYLGRDEAYQVVIENTNKIADEIEEFGLWPEVDNKNGTVMPIVECADSEIHDTAYETAKKMYGDPLPEIVEARLKRELDSIINNGFAVLYWSAARLVKKSNSDGYLVGSRGSVGSSLAATMAGITEVNPLPPHYICENCKHSDFDVDVLKYDCGVDMPPKKCPVCGHEYKRDGYNIPFEVFLGINADKVPDIDLNFSGDYQPQAHKYTEVLFGPQNVFRAGTISAIKDKIAYGYVKKYLEAKGLSASNAEINRLSLGISGVKKTTGQHPGGIVIVPKNREVYEFTAVQRPADKTDTDTVTTHFDFNSMHDILVKLDILGHDVPTIIRHLQDITGVDPLTMPLDDKETMKLFSGLESLHIKPDDVMGITMGTLGIPEFGTKFVRQMLEETKPQTMSELVRISGLSHGTDVWLKNAQDLIHEGIATLSECICTRDDIMNYLVAKGVEKRTAFFTMEFVRKGQWAKNKNPEKAAEFEKAMREANVEEWFIDSCKKIKYMFPKAHAVAYVVMAYRIAYCKVHYPEAFYATYFTVRSGEFDCTYVKNGKAGIEKNVRELENKFSKTANEKNMITMLEVACEMYARGIEFLPVDLEKSQADKFVIEGHGIRLPFLSIPKLGENAAKAIVEARDTESFKSIEDLKKRAKISTAVIEEMQSMGTLAGISESNQLSLFDFQ